MTERQNGFTLLELVCVMAIMALLLAMLLPAYVDWGRGSAMRGSLLNVQASLSLARQLAMTRATRTRFDYGNLASEPTGYYRILDVGVALTTTNELALTTTNYLADGVLFNIGTDTVVRIEFKPDGTCAGWSGNAVALVLREVEERGSAGLAATVTIHRLTGHTVCAGQEN